MIRITVSELCEGHGNCYARFPKLFAPNDSSFSEPISDVVEDDQRRNLRRAVGGCPAGAISIEDIGESSNSVAEGAN